MAVHPSAGPSAFHPGRRAGGALSRPVRGGGAGRQLARRHRPSAGQGHLGCDGGGAQQLCPRGAVRPVQATDGGKDLRRAGGGPSEPRPADNRQADWAPSDRAQAHVGQIQKRARGAKRGEANPALCLDPVQRRDASGEPGRGAAADRPDPSDPRASVFGGTSLPGRPFVWQTGTRPTTAEAVRRCMPFIWRLPIRGRASGWVWWRRSRPIYERLLAACGVDAQEIASRSAECEGERGLVRQQRVENLCGLARGPSEAWLVGCG